MQRAAVFLPFSNPKWFCYFWLFVGLWGFTSCTDECETTITYTVQDPITMTRSQMVQGVKSEAARSLASPGKIYSYGRYVFVNELYKGIHVIDNSNPAAPKNTAFISIPGNVDLAIRDNILFADAGPDLLALDISNPAQAVLKNIPVNIFPDNIFRTTNAPANPSLSDNITIGYTSRVVTEKRSCTDENNAVFERNDGFVNTLNASSFSSKERRRNHRHWRLHGAVYHLPELPVRH
jgi:hypothetical protein